MTEAEEQKIIIKWFRGKYPQYAKALRVSQGGDYRGSGRKGAIRMARAKAAGYVKGEADMVFLIPTKEWHGLVIEYKAEKGTHKATTEQVEYLNFMLEMGYKTELCKGIDQAKQAIGVYMGDRLGLFSDKTL